MPPIFDVYDDPTGEVLKRKFASIREIPPFIKTAACVAPSDSLPDGSYALVAFDRTGTKMRKFACVDQGNTALSVIYFLEGKNQFSKTAQVKIAQRLVEACVLHKLDVPEILQKLAESPEVSASLGGALDRGAGGSPEVAPVIPKGDAIVDRLVGKETSSRPKAEETSNELAARWVNELNREVKDRSDPMRSWHKDEVQKTASVLRTEELLAPKPKKAAANIQFLLPDRKLYPIAGEGEKRAEMIRLASRYYDDNWKALSPRDRHTYAVNLTKEAEALQIQVSGGLFKYASRSVGPDFRVMVETRKSLLDQAWHPVLDEVVKQASTNPEMLAETLGEFDRASGLDRYWGRSVADPWHSVFHMEKEAEVLYEGPRGPVTEQDLRALLSSPGREKLSGLFGADFVTRFAQEPSESFSALPLPTKQVIAGLL